MQFVKHLRITLAKVFHIFSQTSAHFKTLHLTQFAASLSYSTLLAVVPATALLFFLSMQTELFSSMFEQVREQILIQLLPASRESVESYLLETTKNIKSFSYLSISIIFISAIWLSLGVERVMNHIWSVKTPRRLVLRIPAHITLWIFTPVLITLSMSISTWIFSLPYLDNISQQVSFISRLLPWLISSSALLLLYYFVPNTHVTYKNAFMAALFSGMLFELSKWAFTLYITHFAMYEKLYGALSTLPLFMLWVFISWLIVLWGAAFCVAMQSEQRHH